ncbi:MAG: hypothetical protein ACYCQI_14440 [Gammaproteobacteria bacterium]
MSRLSVRLSLLLVCFFSLFFCMNVQADTTTTVVEKRTIVTPAPTGNCTSVAAHWDGNTWVAAHDVCRYENRTEGAAWVQDYWSCTDATPDGTCTNWALVPGHWVKTLE